MAEDVQSRKATQAQAEAYMNEVCSSEDAFDFAFTTIMAPSSSQ